MIETCLGYSLKFHLVFVIMVRKYSSKSAYGGTIHFYL